MSERESGRAEHRAAGPERVRVAVLTISDTRTLETDTSGDYLATALANAGHLLVERRIVRDDPEAIRDALESLLQGPAQVVISSGGTGIAGRDHTVPIAESLILKPLPGFGELFRMLSYG
jgi:molybdopterin adenylyltransferase